MGLLRDIFRSSMTRTTLLDRIFLFLQEQDRLHGQLQQTLQTRQQMIDFVTRFLKTYGSDPDSAPFAISAIRRRDRKQTEELLESLGFGQKRASPYSTAGSGMKQDKRTGIRTAFLFASGFSQGFQKVDAQLGDLLQRIFAIEGDDLATLEKEREWLPEHVASGLVELIAHLRNAREGIQHTLSMVRPGQEGVKTQESGRPDDSWRQLRKAFSREDLEAARAYCAHLELHEALRQLATRMAEDAKQHADAQIQIIIYELAQLGVAEQHAHNLLSLPRDTIFGLFLELDRGYLHEFEKKYQKAFGAPFGGEAIQALAKTDYRTARKIFDERLDLQRLKGTATDLFGAFQAITFLLTPIHKSLDDHGSDQHVYKELFLSYIRQGVKHLELRLFFNESYLLPKEGETLFKKRLQSLRDGLAQARQETGKDLHVYLILSFGRKLTTAQIIQEFTWFWSRLGTIVLAQTAEGPLTVKDVFVGIDVCGDERGDSPFKYEPLFKALAAYNARYPKNPLLLTFHAGEVLTADRSLTPQTLIRWVHELVLLHGTHVKEPMRLGHGNVLGMSPEQLTRVREFRQSVRDRLGDIRYDLTHSKELRTFKVMIDEDRLRAEELTLEGRGEEERLDLPVGPEQYEELRCRQRFVLNDLLRRGVVIETSPTSNVTLNESISSYRAHPLREFRRRGIDFTINTDDAGIFGTNIIREYHEIAKAMKLQLGELRKIAATSQRSLLVNQRTGQSAKGL